VLAADIGHRCAGSCLLEYCHDLAVAESGLFLENILGKSYEKIALLTSATLWGDY